MKKIIHTLALVALSYIGLAQNTNTTTSKKYTQLSIRGGYDQATKHNFTQYTNAKLKGFNVGASLDKYWGVLGAGFDFDYMNNAAPTYDPTTFNSKLAPWAAAPWGARGATVAATKLSRGFVGIGPSVKYQSANNKFTAELNIRGGATLTTGSALQFASTGNPAWAFNRNGDGSGGINTKGTYYHSGYNQEWIATTKAQVRFNYYVTPQVGINLGAYYMNYFGSEERYNYLDVDKIDNSTKWYWWQPPGQDIYKVNTSRLSSFGATVGVSYRIGQGTTTSKAAKNNLSVTVKDELTGQPLTSANVTIQAANGTTYNATTDATGLAKFTKLPDASYTISGTLHDIATTQGNATVNSSNRNATATLIHNDPRFTVVGKAINLSTNKPESDVSVSLKNNNKGSIKMGTSQSGSGAFSFQIDSNSDYELVGKKASYISNIEKISTKGLTRSQTLYVELEIGVQAVVAGKALLLQKIYYDLDKTNISQDASTDLNKLVIFLQDNPTFTVEIASHTDSRGSDEYNLKLSQGRAQAVVDYLVLKGINKANLIAQGYGETRLINTCANGVVCTEDEHQLNRRTEFTVISK